MIHPALLHLARRHLVGVARYRLRQLRRPQYAISLALVALYFGFMLLGPMSSSRAGVGASEFVSLFAGPYAGLILAAHWWNAAFRSAPSFTVADASQLFVLPFTRRELVGYAILRPQLTLMLISTFVALMALQWKTLGFVHVLFGVYLMLNLFHLNGVLAALVMNAVRQRMRPGLLVFLPCAVLLGWVLLPPLTAGLPEPLTDLDAWREVLHGGLTRVLHSPLILLAGLLGTGTGAEYAWGLLLGSVVCAAMLAGSMVLDDPFEEAALAQAEKVGKKIEAVRKGGLAAVQWSNLRTARSTRLSLAPNGPPWRAVLWATVVGEWRAGPWQFSLWVALAYVLLLIALMLAKTGQATWMVAAVAPIGVLALMILAVTRLMPTSMRNEFSRLAEIKALPLDGRRLLRGRVWGGALVCVLPLGVVGIAVTAAFLQLTSRPLEWVMPLAIAAIPALATWIALMSAVESALVLTFPAWLVSENGEGNFDQMGGWMMALSAQWIAASLLLLVPVAAGVIIGLLAVLAGAGPWGAIPGVLVGAVVIAAECEMVLMLAGRRFDLMDAAT